MVLALSVQSDYRSRLRVNQAIGHQGTTKSGQLVESLERKPKVSVVVVVYNMPREARRTLHSLSAEYQRHIDADDYEVIDLRTLRTVVPTSLLRVPRVCHPPAWTPPIALL